MISRITFNPEISIGDLVATGGFIVAAVALVLTLLQLRKDSIGKRAEFIVSVLTDFMTEPDTSGIFYRLEYEGGFQYGPNFHGSEEERHLDRLLGYYERIALLYKIKAVSRSDLEIVQYHFLRVYQHPEVRNYFSHLDAFPDVLGVPGCTFGNFRKVAAMIEESVSG